MPVAHASNPPMPFRPGSGTIAVVGAGVVGTATALVLVRDGHDVILIDRDEPGRGCSYGNAGHIATEQLLPLASFATLRRVPGLLLKSGGPLGIRKGALPILARGWARDFLAACLPRAHAHGTAVLSGLIETVIRDWRTLLVGTGAEGRFQTRGHHSVWESAAPEAAIAASAAAARDLGVPVTPWGPSPGDWPDLPLALRQRVTGGMTYTGTGHVNDPFGLTQDLAAAFVARGGRIERADIQGLESGQGGQGVNNNAGWRLRHAGGVIGADAVLVALGVDSGSLLEPLGYRVPMIAERGYHVVVPADSGPHTPILDRPVVFENRTVIVTPMAMGLRATSFTDFSGPDDAPDPRRPALLRHHLREVGLMAPGAESSEWTGCRPSLPDYLPMLDASRRHPGLYAACGHQHLGLTLAAVSARRMADIVAGRALPDPAMALDRFS
ncbi:NAD(P)/FAD-dependent oxidoreductase [Nitrospirillum amazonense]|uniref:NAD(P)/FAD-dependent oxidoreductase n=1 Tax=Nitrospirillum amazonense TaxID=28077 RepID=UPI0024124095|nr:FAD-binding oxidoreductase [Nitrospirillum amazonense]MDG3442388.1 FAD-binding oxidoreductase [Nitrospirillum amazonense]